MFDPAEILRFCLFLFRGDVDVGVPRNAMDFVSINDIYRVAPDSIGRDEVEPILLDATRSTDWTRRCRKVGLGLIRETRSAQQTCSNNIVCHRHTLLGLLY